MYIFYNDIYMEIFCLQVRFSKPLLPGQTLKTEMWKGNEGIHFQCQVSKIILLHVLVKSLYESLLKRSPRCSHEMWLNDIYFSTYSSLSSLHFFHQSCSVWIPLSKNYQQQIWHHHEFSTHPCVYVCMYIYIYIYIHMHTHAHNPSTWAECDGR